ncbi:MAG: type II toxin-antitoxin system RelE/ParE family toxin [Corynebacterium sp.]|uniref:type II toxin-antitoxin system RelE/ParE family toxin n=1 Tax=Corynebacterium sp. TaxID=1720 RepID=UPI0026E0A763|nr:type II toxin-antitoxin system RelE/ParE family toxin [Corynebacterium sp.]MDO5670711.1 type II toxin-antitoxin system RelE/ParE family toxin [Corynebacterium sp.]
MRVLYEGRELELIAEDPGYKVARWNAEIIKSYRKKIQIIKSATDERDLRAMKSLRLEKLSGDREGTSSIRLNRKYRLILRFDTDQAGLIVVVLEMVDYHR